MLCRTIRNDEEIPKCAEIGNESRNRQEIMHVLETTVGA